MGGVFSVPPGDPDGLQDVVRRLSGLSQTVGATRSDRLRACASAAEEALPTARVADFASARADVLSSTQAVGLSLVTVSGALGDYATELREAKSTIGSAASAYDQSQEMWRRARSMGEEDVATEYSQDMERQRTRASEAHEGLGVVERRVAQSLSGEIDIWAPGLSTLSPVRAWEHASAQMLPTRISLEPESLRDVYDNLDPADVAGAGVLAKLVKGATKGKQGYDVLAYLRAPALARSAEEKFLKTRTAYQALKGSNPNLGSRMSYLRYLRSERAMLKAYASRNPAEVIRAQRHFKLLRGMRGESTALRVLQQKYPSLLARQITGPPARFARLARVTGRVGPIFNKVMGPVAIGLGAYDLFTAATDDSMDTDDRFARGVGGTATVVGGVTTVALAFGLVSNPVGWAILAVSGVVAVGAWAYENWDTVTETADRAWEGTKDLASDAWEGTKDVGSGFKDGVSSAWNGLFG